jgi:hypothetical protein
MKRYEGLSQQVLASVDANLTWSDIVSNFLIEPEKKRIGRVSNDTFQKVPKLAKVKTKKHPTTLEATTTEGLRGILKSLSLPTTGTKRELVARIVANRPIPPSISQPAPMKPKEPKESPRMKKKRVFLIRS